MNSHLRIGYKIKTNDLFTKCSSNKINMNIVVIWAEKWRSSNFTGKVGIPEGVFNLVPSSKIQNKVSLSSEME